MLFVTLLLAIAGFLLVSAGIRGGSVWREPWRPAVNAIKKP